MRPFDMTNLPPRMPKRGVIVVLPEGGATHEALTEIAGDEMWVYLHYSWSEVRFSEDREPGGARVKFRARPGKATWLPKRREGETFQTWSWEHFINVRDNHKIEDTE